MEAPGCGLGADAAVQLQGTGGQHRCGPCIALNMKELYTAYNPTWIQRVEISQLCGGGEGGGDIGGMCLWMPEGGVEVGRDLCGERCGAGGRRGAKDTCGWDRMLGLKVGGSGGGGGGWTARMFSGRGRPTGCKYEERGEVKGCEWSAEGVEWTDAWMGCDGGHINSFAK